MSLICLTVDRKKSFLHLLLTCMHLPNVTNEERLPDQHNPFRFCFDENEGTGVQRIHYPIF